MKSSSKSILLAMASVALASGTASADPKHAILVLKSDGNADAKFRAKLDAAVVKLAKSAPDGNVTAGDLSYNDAALAAGCKPDAPTCKDEVMATFATDEIVIVSAARKPGVVEVSVRRAAKGAAPRDATAKVPADATDVQLDSVGPLFGAAPVDPLPTPPPLPSDTVTPPPPAISTTTTPPPVETTTPPPLTSTDHEPMSENPPVTPPTTTGPTPIAGPITGPSDESSHQKLYVVGMVGGGVLALLGVGLWSSAVDVQDQINHAPTKTIADFRHIQDLESRGDSLTGAGNVLFVAGLVAAGVSTYFFVRDRRRHPARTAIITPTVFDHGAGVALTFGGLR